MSLPNSRGQHFFEFVKFWVQMPTGYLTLREEHRMRVFENMVLRRIFGPRKEEVVGGWRRLHNEKLETCSTRGR
jgi:hypothetical protein